MTTMRELFDLYKRVWQEHHTNPDRLNAHVPEPKYGIVRHVYVAETDAQALQEARAAFADFIRNFNYLRVAHGDTSGRAAYLADFDARLAEGLHIVGSPGYRQETGPGARADHGLELLRRFLLRHPHHCANAAFPAPVRRGGHAGCRHIGAPGIA